MQTVSEMERISAKLTCPTLFALRCPSAVVKDVNFHELITTLFVLRCPSAVVKDVNSHEPTRHALRAEVPAVCT